MDTLVHSSNLVLVIVAAAIAPHTKRSENL